MSDISAEEQVRVRDAAMGALDEFLDEFFESPLQLAWGEGCTFKLEVGAGDSGIVEMLITHKRKHSV
jgi:hypothetical protein